MKVSSFTSLAVFSGVNQWWCHAVLENGYKSFLEVSGDMLPQ